MSSVKKDEFESEKFSDIEEADDGLLLPDDKSDNSGRSASRTNLSLRWLWYKAAIGILTLLVVTNLSTYWITKSTGPQLGCQESVAEPSSLAPILRNLNLKTMQVKFDSTFFSKGSRYRERPSPETDAAWDFAGANFGYILIPEDQEKESDLTANHIHFAGGADQAYLKGIPADVEVFHQLHCLNLLRKATWYNHDYYRKQGAGEFQHPDKTLSIHVDHCIDNLRQRLMCTSDVGLVPFYWVGDDGQTDPEFSRVHTCRDFETLHDWMMLNMIKPDSNTTLLPRPGDYRVEHFH